MKRALQFGGPGGAEALEAARRVYRRTLANWAGDLLNARLCPRWRPTDPTEDYRDRDWRRLYAGSVLDD